MNKYELPFDIKKSIIDYVYSTVDIYKFKYKLLENSSDLSNFQENKFLISANFSGFNYLLVFCKIKGRNYSCFIDRKTLSFNQAHLKYESINVIPVNYYLENNIYNGTIIDGIYIKHDKKREKIYVITDVYYFRGKSTELDKLNEKLFSIEKYLEYNLKNNKNVILTTNKLYNLEDIDKLIYEDIKTTRDFHIRGISFYPEISGTKLIYVFNDELDKKILNKESTVISDDIIKPELTKYVDKKKIIVKYTVNEKNKKTKEINFNLELRKTDISDVYKIYCVDEVLKNNKNILKIYKLGIAYIPTKEISIMCRDILSKSPRAMFQCKFDESKNKWIPIKNIDSCVPDKISDIRKILDITEESEETE